MPSKQERLAIGLRPPRADAFGSGSSGAISAHCASVMSSTFLAIEHLHSTASRTTIQEQRKSSAARIPQKPLHGYETGSKNMELAELTSVESSEGEPLLFQLFTGHAHSENKRNQRLILSHMGLFRQQA
jgi:hypothetical protein